MLEKSPSRTQSSLGSFPDQPSGVDGPCVVIVDGKYVGPLARHGQMGAVGITLSSPEDSGQEDHSSIKALVDTLSIKVTLGSCTRRTSPSRMISKSADGWPNA
ncbi:hypothetical protein EV132_108237 [Rhizobium sullae]|uniref:Uncharacterized protein n=1 Tax=Rhizobium sullae TaxID=50338 RepID=A0A4R3Q3I8_RHISU|nr:hypothetical protein EV132_108237 [Rhizobium sullae]